MHEGAALRRPPRRSLVAAAGAVVVIALALLAVAALMANDDRGEGGDCAGGVWTDGRSYFPEPHNSGVLTVAELGAVVGVVERTRACPSREGDASDLPIGTELRAAPGVDTRIGIAAVAEGEVVFFRTLAPPEGVNVADALLLDDVAHIGLNSEWDGATRWATITEPADVDAVVGAIRAGAAAEVSSGDEYDRIFLELVRSDGLRSRSPYHLDDAVLVATTGGLVVDDPSDVIERALAHAPPAPVTDGLAVVGEGGTAATHPQGHCRRDRPDVRTPPSDVLRIAGARGALITFVFVTGANVEPFAVYGDDLEGGIPLPDSPGPVIVELISDATAESFCTVVEIRP